MASWRDTASQQVQDDLDGLLSVVLPFAQETLQKRGEFYPFGARVSSAGETGMVAAQPDASEHPASVAVLEAIIAGLRGHREMLRAIAICSDVRLGDSDAVRVELEHRDGHAMAVLLPYKKKRLGRGVDFGSLEAAAASQQVWG